MIHTSLTIGPLSRRAGVNVQTVRYYHRRGLLPAPPPASRGRRVYSEETLTRLFFIRRAQRLGFTLDEISELLSLFGQAGCSPACRIAERRLADIEHRMAELAAMKRAVRRLVFACRSGGEDEACPIIRSLTREWELLGSGLDGPTACGCCSK